MFIFKLLVLLEHKTYKIGQVTCPFKTYRKGILLGEHITMNVPINFQKLDSFTVMAWIYFFYYPCVLEEMELKKW